jgi:hypothetical protein
MIVSTSDDIGWAQCLQDRHSPLLDGFHSRYAEHLRTADYVKDAINRPLRAVFLARVWLLTQP